MRTEAGTTIDYKAFPVLYVDDETDNLRSFELTFRREFSVVTTANGADALEVLATRPIAVVLSDHRMPGITGTDLLARVRELVPATVRLLVTAYGDASTLAQAINHGCIYRYIPKPWDVDEMREIVRQAIELYALEAQRRDLVTELHALHRATQGIVRHRDPSQMLDLGLRTIVSDFGFDAASLFVAADSGRGVRLRSAYPRPEMGDEALEGVQFVREKDSGSGVLAILDSGASVLVEADRVCELERSVRDFITDLAAQEVLIVPLLGRRGLLGAIAVDNRRGGRGFGVTETEILESLSSQLAIAFENALLIGDLRNDAARTSGAEALVIGEALGASLIRELCGPLLSADKGDCLSTIVATARSACEGFGLMLEGQRPARCDLVSLMDVARNCVSELTAERRVAIELERGSLPKVDALPGRLLQLLIHVLELSVQNAEPGTVVVSLDLTDDARAIVVSASVCWSPAVGSVAVPEWETGLMRLTACEALARELGGTIEIEPKAKPATLRLTIPLTPANTSDTAGTP